LNGGVSDSVYARAGVDQAGAGSAVRALVDVLAGISPGRDSRSVLASGHYASVLSLDDTRGLALSCDGVGTKVIVAEKLGRLDTVGIDCIAMNVNDVICVGADPIAVLDYIAVEQADPAALTQIARGLRAGAEEAGVEIPGGELAVLPELIRGHPAPHGFDLLGFCVGLVDLDAVVTGADVQQGDAIIGLPSSGVHSNGLTLARRALGDGDERLLEPTVIYVRAIRELMESSVDVHGLAHITGEGLLNLLRLEAEVGYLIDQPLPVPAVFNEIAERGSVEPAEMYEVFNMGCGFCCVVAAEAADEALSILGRRHPGAGVIGRTTTAQGVVELTGPGLRGTRAGLTAVNAGRAPRASR
jgi:phosphoribosylformylglycinamidine cyclo-ligase